MKDLIIGMATGYTWEQVQAFAVSTVWCGFEGHKVLFVYRMAPDARANLQELGFELIDIPPSAPMLGNIYGAQVTRFFLIYRYLRENPEYRYVFAADVRDLIFQGNPSRWVEQNLGDFKLVAASEFLNHEDSPPNMQWVRGMFAETQEWLEPKDIYCSGFIAGRSEYVLDLCFAIYNYARHFTTTTWGSDQPIYNTIMHQRAYKDATLVPKAADFFCVNCVNVAFPLLRVRMTDHPPVRAFYDFCPHFTANANLLCDGSGGIPVLTEYCVLHQYDRLPEIAINIRKVFTLENVRAGHRPFHLELSKF